MGSSSAALLVVSNVKQIGKSLKAIAEHVNPLYIHLNIPAGLGSGGPPPQWGRLISQMYVDGGLYHGPQRDMRILVGPLKRAPPVGCSSLSLHHQVDVIYADTAAESQLCNELRRTLNVRKEPVYLNDDGPATNDLAEHRQQQADATAAPNALKMYNTVVLGGTFDRIHLGHKIFLSHAVLRASKKLVVGVTTARMTGGKTLPELILPVEQRIREVLEFLQDIDGGIAYEVVPIDDAYGPTQHDPDMDMIVVSAETLRGGHKVNEVRTRKNLRPLEIFSIEVVESSVSDGPKESKVSSSNSRIDLLGTRLRQPEPRPHLPRRPYIIGLTGGIATGKSKMAGRFKELGATVWDCDKIAHEIYEPGQKCYTLIVQHFGDQIVSAADGRINRPALGALVFSDPHKLEALNGIVWPELMSEVKRRIAGHMTEHPETAVIMLEAAILLKAGWQSECHEVWSMIVPPELAVQRVQQRNGLSEEEARKRLASQMPNSEVVAKSQVVFSSQWSEEFTQQQAERAWRMLQQELAAAAASGGKQPNSML